MPAVLVPIIVVLVVVAGLIAGLLAIRRIAEPNQALIISGVRAEPPPGADESMGFRIVTGRGTFVVPFLQKARALKLNLHEAELYVECVTQQGIPVTVRGAVMYKVGDDLPSIANAARRFLDQQDQMDGQVHTVFAGHLRSIIGNMTVEELIRDRDKLEGETRKSSGDEMVKLGLVIDSLKIQEIEDPTGYIENLAKPHIAQVQRDARIAEATNNQTAAEQEAAAAAVVAGAQRESAIKQAGYTAEVQEAQARAAQAGPLANATARQDVVRQATAVALLEAEQVDRKLDGEVRKPADAANYQRIKQAEAERQAEILAAEADAARIKLHAAAQAEQTRSVGEAEGTAISAKGRAEGEALKARADGLAANQEAVIGQQLTERMPQIVAEAAGAFAHVDNLTVLNGASGLMDAMNTIIASSVETLNTIRTAMNGHTNGHVDVPVASVAGLGKEGSS